MLLALHNVWNMKLIYTDDFHKHKHSQGSNCRRDYNLIHAKLSHSEVAEMSILNLLNALGVRTRVSRVGNQPLRPLRHHATTPPSHLYMELWRWK